MTDYHHRGASMTKQAKPGFSATAELTCLLRAKSYGEKRPLFKTDDYVAVILSQSFHSPFSLQQKAFLLGDESANFATAPGIYEYIVARTRFIDDIVKKTAGRFSKIFILGAGYDSRAIRFYPALQHSLVYEIDRPLMQQHKIKKLAECDITPPSNLRFLPIDFNQQNLSDALAQIPLQTGDKCLFLLEGLLMYLEPAHVKNLFNAISDYSSDGSQIIFDFVNQHALTEEILFGGDEAGYGVKESVDCVRRIGEKWTFGIAATEVEKVLQQYGFALLDYADASKLAARFFADERGRCQGKINAAPALVYASREKS